MREVYPFVTLEELDVIVSALMRIRRVLVTREEAYALWKCWSLDQHTNWVVMERKERHVGWRNRRIGAAYDLWVKRGCPQDWVPNGEG